MTKTLIPLFLIIVFISGCQDDGTVNDPVNMVGIVDKVYGVGFSGSAAVGWEFTSPSIDRFGVYRHLSAIFSVTSATRIGTVLISSKPGIVDTGLVNGTMYYYTVVPEQQQKDGSFVIGLGTKMIALTPNNNAAVPTEQIVYSQHIQSIFSTNCAVHGCHADPDHAKFQSLSHGGSTLNLTSWTAVMTGTDEIAQIIPLRASKSHIIQHLNTDTLIAPVAGPSMPPGFSFPKELRDLLIRWIENGAKFDDGSMAYSAMPARGWAYVTNQGEDLTAVIDLDQNKLARYVTTGVTNPLATSPHGPHNVVVDRQNQFYYVNLIVGSKLLKFRVTDNMKVGELTAGLSSPAQVALTKNGDTAYVSNFENAKKNITIVNTMSMTKLADVGSPAMLKPHGVTLTPNFRYVIVANSLSDNVTVIQTSDNTIVKTIPMSGNVPALPINYAYQYEPYQSVVTPDNKFVYVTCRKSGEVRVIDLEQMNVVDSIKVEKFPLIPAISPAGDFVFVANRNSYSVSIINTTTRMVEHTIPNVGVEPHGIAVSKDAKYLYVSCENLGESVPPHHATVGGMKPSFLKVIDIATRKVIASLELGNFGSGLAVTN
ncbi:MAG: YncE family protein [Bacteriovoracaceae bacterium]|nr:YncE family protein [Bacteroidota bacterium]